MGKGLCSEEKSWLEKLDIGNKIITIMKKVKNAIGKMFQGNGAERDLDNTQKAVRILSI